MKTFQLIYLRFSLAKYVKNSENIMKLQGFFSFLTIYFKLHHLRVRSFDNNCKKRVPYFQISCQPNMDHATCDMSRVRHNSSCHKNEYYRSDVSLIFACILLNLILVCFSCGLFSASSASIDSRPYYKNIHRVVYRGSSITMHSYKQ